MKIKYFVFATILTSLLAVSACQTTAPSSDTTEVTSEQATVASSAQETVATSEQATAAVTEEQTEFAKADDEISTEEQIITAIQNDVLTIENLDGKYYLNFTEGNDLPDGTDKDSLSCVLEDILFSSLADMQQKFISGNFSKAEINHLKAELILTDKGFETFNMRSLYDVALPNESWVKSMASLVKYRYAVFFESEAEEAYGNIIFCTDAYFEMQYQSDVVKDMEKRKENILPDETEYLGYPCVVYEYETEVAKLRTVIFRMENEYGYVDVRVKYCLEHTLKPERGNAEVPRSITFYGTDNRQNYILQLWVSEAPTKELFTSFAVVPFENESAVIESNVSEIE